MVSRRDGYPSQASPPKMTDQTGVSAGLTLMTLPLNIPPMTDDTSPLVRRPIRAQEAVIASDATSVTTKRRRPAWLYDGPLTDRARLVSCNRCRRPVLEALADGVMPARVDLAHLTPLQELEHLLAGGMTLRLWPDPATTDERRLAFRHAWNIHAHPGRGLPVHQCAVVRHPDPTLLTYRAHSAWPEEPNF